MPSTRPGARGTDPFDQARHAARELLRRAGVDAHDILVVLGTGLSGVATRLGATESSIDLSALPWFPRFTGLGHRPEAWSITLGNQRVLVMAGRLHLYEGCTPAEVAHPIRTALATGCRTAILTCSAGAIRRGLGVGQLVLVRDHINLTATSPLIGIPSGHSTGLPYVDLTSAWSAHLRDLARQAEPSLPDGIYAQVIGPNLETPAEIRMLADLGADLVGMSLVPEVIAARHLGADVLGLAIVTNAAAGTDQTGPPVPLSPEDIANAAEAAADDVAHVVRSVILSLGDDAGAEEAAPES